jgi:hypothetical protein
VTFVGLSTLFGAPRTLGRWLLSTFWLLFAMTCADYIFGVTSDSYSYARNAVSASAAMQRLSGGVKTVRLHWLWGFKYQTGFGNSTSSVDLHVTGALRSFDVAIDLKQVDGQWTIARSSVPL